MSKYVIFDLDNCLSNDEPRISRINWRAMNPDLRYRGYHAACGEDRVGNRDVFDEATCDATPVFLTARPDWVRAYTLDWLKRHFGIYSPLLLMRASKDHRPSVQLKESQLLELRDRHDIYAHNIVAAYDDRADIVEMYRSHDITAHILSIHPTCAYTPPWTNPPELPGVLAATEEDLDALRALAQARTGVLPDGHGTPSRRAPEILAAAAATFAQRNAIYGDNYLRFGRIFLSLFPDGVLPPVTSPREMDRLQLMMQALNKLTRYAEAFSRGGHLDSAHDLCVYAAMLEEMTNE